MIIKWILSKRDNQKLPHNDIEGVVIESEVSKKILHFYSLVEWDIEIFVSDWSIVMRKSD